MFAIDRFGIVPDILVLAKAIGGGMPLGAFISSGKIMSVLSSNPQLGHITTFGGHPVAAQQVASLEVILEENCRRNAKENQDLLKQTWCILL